MLSHVMIPAILALGAFTFGFAGFGFALVVVPLLALMLPVKGAVALQFPAMTLLSIYNAWRYGRAIGWKPMWSFYIAAFLTVPLGLYALIDLPEGIIKKGLAFFIFLTVVANRFKWGERLSGSISVSKLWGLLMGGLSGWLQGAYASGGPPAVVYVMGITDDPEEAKGHLGTYFAASNIGVMTPLYWTGGLITEETLLATLAYSPAIIIFLALGMWFFKRASNESYKIVVDCLLVITSVLLWVRS